VRQQQQRQQQQQEHRQLTGESRLRARRAACASAERRLPRSPRSDTAPRALDALVETAMLAACTGLAYHLSSAFRLEAYLGAFFPLPTVLAAARWRGVVAVKTTARVAFVACMYMQTVGADAPKLIAWRRLRRRCCCCCWVGRCERALICCCTVRRVRFLALAVLPACSHCSLRTSCEPGSLGLAVGLTWRQRLPWLVTIPCAALVRTAGVFASLLMSSVLMRENVLALIMAQACAPHPGCGLEGVTERRCAARARTRVCDFLCALETRRAQMYALLDQMAAAVGVAATPDFQWVYLLAGALVRCRRAALPPALR
jgi:hypothetical protein